MTEPEVFVLADRALNRVVGQIRDDQWEIELPKSFRTRRMDHTPTLQEIVNYHAYDDAWVPDMLAGKTIEEAGDEKFKGDNPTLDALFADMKKRGTILDATVYVYEVMWQVPNAQPRPYCSLALAEKIAGEAHRAGVKISAGTDAPGAWDAPYPSLDDELALLVHGAGFTPMDAIVAATRIGAMTIAQEQNIGTIAPGKLANLFFVAKNPLADIANIKTVTLTVKRGAQYFRKDYRPITKDEAKGEM